jgi:prepilin-type N-terminal cleavage/methylation domain-containing protein
MKAKKAFTLMELLTVIAVMAVLAGLLLPALSKAREKARNAAAESMIASLQTALSMYNMDYGVYPASSNVDSAQYNGNSFDTVFDGTPNNLVAALTAMTKGGPYMEFRGSDLDESGGDYVVLDPWGRAYVYTCRRALNGVKIAASHGGPFHPDTASPENNAYNIFTLGPDGETYNGADYPDGTDWNESGLLTDFRCGDWQSAVNELDPRWDDINSWDGAR